MELVTSTAVTQNASQVRCVADRPWCGLWVRIASSTAAIKALTKGAGLPRIIGISRLLSPCTTPGELIDTLSLTQPSRTSYNGATVAGRAVYRGRMEAK